MELTVLSCMMHGKMERPKLSLINCIYLPTLPYFTLSRMNHELRAEFDTSEKYLMGPRMCGDWRLETGEDVLDLDWRLIEKQAFLRRRRRRIGVNCLSITYLFVIIERTCALSEMCKQVSNPLKHLAEPRMRICTLWVGCVSQKEPKTAGPGNSGQ